MNKTELTDMWTQEIRTAFTTPEPLSFFKTTRVADTQSFDSDILSVDIQLKEVVQEGLSVDLENDAVMRNALSGAICAGLNRYGRLGFLDLLKQEATNQAPGTMNLENEGAGWLAILPIDDQEQIFTNCPEGIVDQILDQNIGTLPTNWTVSFQHIDHRLFVHRDALEIFVREPSIYICGDDLKVTYDNGVVFTGEYGIRILDDRIYFEEVA